MPSAELTCGRGSPTAATIATATATATAAITTAATSTATATAAAAAAKSATVSTATTTTTTTTATAAAAEVTAWAAAESAATAGWARALATFFGFVDANHATVELSVVEAFDCTTCVFGFGHGNESEATRAPGFAIEHNLDFGDFAELCKSFLQNVFGRIERQVAYVESGTHFTSLERRHTSAMRAEEVSVDRRAASPNDGGSHQALPKRDRYRKFPPLFSRCPRVLQVDTENVRGGRLAR
jgi:hypothetical protein